MRPVDLALLSVTVVLGCARPAPSRSTTPDAKPPAAEARPAADGSTAGGPPPLIEIAAFDCEKYDVPPNQTPPKGLIAPRNAIRAWNAGGPQGANWNVDDLRCAVRASTPCTNGKVLFTFRVGQHIVAEREAPVSNGAADLELVLPSAAWERGYDSPAKAAAPFKLPFKTAGFRVQAALDCEAPMKASLRDWSYRYVATDDAFVAGFASGE
jgi:hypothetical protein